MRLRCSALCALAAALVVAPQAAGDSFGVLTTPNSTASGTFRVVWTDELHPSVPRLIHTEGSVTYTVEGRLRGPGDGATWITEPLPDFVEATVRRGYGMFLLARASVDGYFSTAEYTCDDGSVARTTTMVTGVTAPRALLETIEPTLDLPHRRGTSDVQLAFAEKRDGPHLLAQAIFATGQVATRTTGQDCSGSNENGLSAPGPVERFGEVPLLRLMGSDVAASVQSERDIGVTVSADGASVMTGDRRLSFGTGRGDESLAGTLSLDMRFGGPPHAQRALCKLPSYARMARVRSLRAARALLRRHGIPSAPFGGARHSATRAGSYFLKSASGLGFCGAPLGTRRDPVLYRSRG